MILLNTRIKKWTEFHCIHWNDNNRKTAYCILQSLKLKRVATGWNMVNCCKWEFKVYDIFRYVKNWSIFFLTIRSGGFILFALRTILIERTNQQMNEWMIKRNATAPCEFFEIFWTSLAGKSCLCNTVFIVDLKRRRGKKNVHNNKRCIPRESPKLERCVFCLDFICRISLVPVPGIDHNICVKMCVSNANLHFASHFYCH